MEPTWNPWHALATRPHLTLRWVQHGPRGRIDFETKEITLRRSMPYEERRSVISHELVHDERGPVPRWMCAREEAAVRAESARRLIALDDLLDALRWTRHLGEAALELGVDVPTLQARLLGLDADERSAVARALGEEPVEPLNQVG